MNAIKSSPLATALEGEQLSTSSSSSSFPFPALKSRELGGNQEIDCYYSELAEIVDWDELKQILGADTLTKVPEDQNRSFSMGIAFNGAIATSSSPTSVEDPGLLCDEDLGSEQVQNPGFEASSMLLSPLPRKLSASPNKEPEVVELKNIPGDYVSHLEAYRESPMLHANRVDTVAKNKRRKTNFTEYNPHNTPEDIPVSQIWCCRTCNAYISLKSSLSPHQKRFSSKDRPCDIQSIYVSEADAESLRRPREKLEDNTQKKVAGSSVSPLGLPVVSAYPIPDPLHNTVPQTTATEALLVKNNPLVAPALYSCNACVLNINPNIKNCYKEEDLAQHLSQEHSILVNVQQAREAYFTPTFQGSMLESQLKK